MRELVVVLDPRKFVWSASKSACQTLDVAEGLRGHPCGSRCVARSSRAQANRGRRHDLSKVLKAIFWNHGDGGQRHTSRRPQALAALIGTIEEKQKSPQCRNHSVAVATVTQQVFKRWHPSPSCSTNIHDEHNVAPASSIHDAKVAVQLHFLVRDDDRILPVGRLRLRIARRWCLVGCVVFLEGLPATRVSNKRPSWPKSPWNLD